MADIRQLGRYPACGEVAQYQSDISFVHLWRVIMQEHVFFFDLRNTLGAVDRPGRLLKFRPSTDELLKSVKNLEGARVAAITNVPQGVDAKAMLAAAGLDTYFEKIISTQDPEILTAKAEKPSRKIYELAASAMKVEPSRCTYVSENLVEVLGAINAGMTGVVKKFPPGGDYMRNPIPPGAATDTSSGRLVEALLEGQHMVGKRIVGCAIEIVKQLRASPGQPIAPPMMEGASRLVWLVNNFVDPYHHRVEEEVLLPFGQMRGYSPASTAWVLDEHAQGRAYFKAMDIALRRIQSGNRKAIAEFVNVTEAFAQLYEAHGQLEDDELFVEIGKRITSDDDALMCGMIERLGPPDVTLHYDMIQSMERALGLYP